MREPADGLDHQERMPDVPAPEELPSISELLAGVDDPRAIFLTSGRAVRLRAPGGLSTGTLTATAGGARRSGASDRARS